MHAIFAIAAVVFTIVGAIPIHQRLDRYHDSQDIHLHQRWHWLRTVTWVWRALLALQPF